MNIKEKLASLTANQKKNIYYWGTIIAGIDLFLIVQNSFRFAQTGQCRNYMVFGSQMHACSFAEFVKLGWGWVSFTNVLILLPAAALMVLATYVVDSVFAKKKD